MRIKKWLALALCAVLAGAAFAGCSPTQRDSDTDNSDSGRKLWRQMRSKIEGL